MFRCLLSAYIHRVGFFSWLPAVYRKQTLSKEVHISLTAAASPRNNLGYVCLFTYSDTGSPRLSFVSWQTVWGLCKSAVWSGASHLPATSATKTNKALAGRDEVGWREARPGDTAGHRAGMWGRWHSYQLIREGKYYCILLLSEN